LIRLSKLAVGLWTFVVLSMLESVAWAEDRVGNGKLLPTEGGSPSWETNPPVYGDIQDVSIWSTFIKMILALVLIIGLIYGLVRLFSRQNQFRSRGPMRLLGGVHLAPQKSIQVLEIGEDLYVVGVGEDVRLLRHIPDGEEAEGIREQYNEKSQWETRGIQTLQQLWSQRKTKGLDKQEERLSSGEDFHSLLSEKLDGIRKRRSPEWSSSDSDETKGRST
jgi:flagellar protein FliO/FliZ